MHELSVTESILSIALKHANQQQATRVTDIHIVLGQLSTVVDNSVQFYWDVISSDTICAGAKLHFQRIKARFFCEDCQMEYTLDNLLSPCPRCGGFHIKILAGEEFWLESIEIEK